MSIDPLDLSKILQCDNFLQQLQKASELEGETWRQVFNRPFKNMFRKLDFNRYRKTAAEALSQIHLIRSELALADAKVLVFYELDRHASILESFGHQLLVCLNKLLLKSTGGYYSITDYNRDSIELDRLRELLIESQQSLNSVVLNFLSQFDPADIPDFPPR